MENKNPEKVNIEVEAMQFQMLPSVAAKFCFIDLQQRDNFGMNIECKDIVLKSRKYLNLLLDMATDELELKRKIADEKGIKGE